MLHQTISRSIISVLFLCLLYFHLITAAPAFEEPRDLEDILGEAEWSASQFCAECMLRGLRPDLATRLLSSPLGDGRPKFPEFPDVPLPGPVVIKRCSTRIKAWIVEDFIYVLDEHRGSNAKAVRTGFDDYAQHLTCSMNDFDPTFGTDAYRSKFWPENQQWSEKRLKALRPQDRAYVEDLLNRRRRGSQDDDGGYSPPNFNLRAEVGAKIEGVRRTVQSVKPGEVVGSLQRGLWPAVSSAQAWRGIRSSMASSRFRPPVAAMP